MWQGKNCHAVLFCVCAKYCEIKGKLKRNLIVYLWISVTELQVTILFLRRKCSFSGKRKEQQAIKITSHGQSCLSAFSQMTTHCSYRLFSGQIWWCVVGAWPIWWPEGQDLKSDISMQASTLNNIRKHNSLFVFLSFTSQRFACINIAVCSAQSSIYLNGPL